VRRRHRRAIDPAGACPGLFLGPARTSESLLSRITAEA
jgi:hypothetical protein